MARPESRREEDEEDLLLFLPFRALPVHLGDGDPQTADAWGPPMPSAAISDAAAGMSKSAIGNVPFIGDAYKRLMHSRICTSSSSSSSADAAAVRMTENTPPLRSRKGKGRQK